MSKRGHLEYLADMRDKLVHDYFGVNMDILWDVVTTKLPWRASQGAPHMTHDSSARISAP